MMGAIPAGSLDRKLTIQQLSSARDGMGAPARSYVDQYQNVPCSRRNFSGREKYSVEAGREVSYQQMKFTIRYIAGLTKKHRIVFEGENFDILDLQELDRRQGYVILAQVAK